MTFLTQDRVPHCTDRNGCSANMHYRAAFGGESHENHPLWSVRQKFLHHTLELKRVPARALFGPTLCRNLRLLSFTLKVDVLVVESKRRRGAADASPWPGPHVPGASVSPSDEGPMLSRPTAAFNFAKRHFYRLFSRQVTTVAALAGHFQACKQLSLSVAFTTCLVLAVIVPDLLTW